MKRVCEVFRIQQKQHIEWCRGEAVASSYHYQFHCKCVAKPANKVQGIIRGVEQWGKVSIYWQIDLAKLSLSKQLANCSKQKCKFGLALTASLYKRVGENTN